MVNSAGDMLLYNTMKGCKSFTKIQKPDREVVENILSSSSIEISENRLVQGLYKRGFLVNVEKDERKEMEYQALNYIADNFLHLTIFTTGQCNFRCKYCCEDFEQSKMDEQTQQYIILYVEKNIKYYRGIQIDWFGGEPLLGLDVIRNISESIIRICKNAGKPYIASITSNGYLLTPDVFKQLIKLHVVYYTVTLDGLESTHDYFRSTAGGGRSFATIINNLINIKELRISKVAHINIRTNFTTEMINLLDEYIQFYGNLFPDDRFSFFIKTAMDWGGSSIASVQNSLISNNKLQDIYIKFSSSGKIKNFDIFRLFFEFGGCVCTAAHMGGFVLDTQANVYKCSRIYLKETKIGRITNEGDMQLDYCKAYNWLNPLVMPGSRKCNEKCLNCIFCPICLSEPCARYRVLNDVNALSCPAEIKNIKYIFELLDIGGRNFVVL